MFRWEKFSAIRSTEGATIIEYAVIAPVLLLLIMGIVEYNIIMYASAVLDGSLEAAAREGSTGYVNTSSSSTTVCPSPPPVNGVAQPQTQSQYINCLIGVRVNGLFDTTKLQISYNDTGSNTFNSTTDSPTYATGPCTDNPALANPPSLPLCAESAQVAGDIVVYTVTYPWPIYTPLLYPFFGSSGTYTLKSSSVVKNEPYNVAGSSR